MNNLIAAGWVKSNIFGIYFERIDDGKDHIRNGEMALGGYDSSWYSGKILWPNQALLTLPILIGDSIWTRHGMETQS